MSQAFIFGNSKFNVVCKQFTFLWDNVKTLSFAYNVVLKLEQLDKSLIQMRKRIGPSVLPRGTPMFISKSDDE